ncbi:hypothetical protein, partial [uncultured Paraglaciecola sp.]|uniref:hypothetical protein n=1 Tax=uncultured Paraglaciecola sp. TaxID=1765024 RepID=UPI0025F044A6
YRDTHCYKTIKYNLNQYITENSTTTEISDGVTISVVGKADAFFLSFALPSTHGSQILLQFSGSIAMRTPRGMVVSDSA